MLNAISDGAQARLARAPAKLAYMAETFKQRMKRMRSRAGFRTQQAAASAIGCERGTVGMWEAPSSAVSAVGSDYLLAVAAAYKVRPESINAAVPDDFPWSPAAPAPEGDLYHARLDEDMLAETHKACRKFAQRQGKTFSVETDPARFLHVYLLRVKLPSHLSEDELMEFGASVQTIMTTPQGASADGRSDGVSVTGADEQKVARGGRRRKT